MREDFVIYSVCESYNWFTEGPTLEGVRALQEDGWMSGRFPRPAYIVVVRRKTH